MGTVRTTYTYLSVAMDQLHSYRSYNYYFRIAAIALSGMALLFAIIGVASPGILVSDKSDPTKGSAKASLGYIAYTRTQTGEADVDLKMLESDTCDVLENQKKYAGTSVAANWNTCCGGVKAAFAFIFLGMLGHVVQIAAFALPLAGMKYLDFEVMGNKIVAIVASAVLFFIYMLGWTIPLGQCSKHQDDANASSEYIDMQPGISIAMLIITWIFMIILILLGYMVMQESTDEETGESPKTVEGAADEVPPTEVVVGLNKDDKPAATAQPATEEPAATAEPATV